MPEQFENHPEMRGLLVSSLEELFALLEKSKQEKGTLWFGITGSRGKTNMEVEHDVRNTVQKIIERGDGIVSGGALNVDYLATDETLKLDPDAKKIKIFLPVPLKVYAAHYRRRASEGVITSEQAESLIAQLEGLAKVNPSVVIGNPTNTVVDTKTYYERNAEVVNTADALVGFQVNESKGAGDTITKSLAQKKPVFLKKYQIE